MTYAERIHGKILKQTDPSLPTRINRWGCRVMCLLAIPQYVCGKVLSSKDIIDIIDRGAVVNGVFHTSALCRTGPEERWLINEGFKVLGSDRHGRQVGWTLEHVESVEWEYMIAHWETALPDGHFTLFDRREIELYDPHDPMQAGYTVDKQQIVRKLVYRTWGNFGVKHDTMV